MQMDRRKLCKDIRPVGEELPEKPEHIEVLVLDQGAVGGARGGWAAKNLREQERP
jgi:hypothetical protein